MKSVFNQLDRVILFACLAILCIGFLTLASASKEYHQENIVFRQILWSGFGVLLMFLILGVDYQRFISLAYLLYGINILLLIFVLIIGETIGGAQRWISLGALNLQPSELAKITLILALSAYIGRRGNGITSPGALFGAILLVLPAFLFVLIEPDLGTALLFIPITLAMLFMGGVRIAHLVSMFFLGLCILPIFWHFLKDYQKQRLFVFINPNIDPLGSGYTIIQSKIAIGSGGLLGKGWFAGTQNQLNFLPERHTDFIFSVIGEEWGFFGALLLIFLYLLIVYRSLKTISTSPDAYGRLIATGFITLISVQVIVNIGMTIGFLPVVGLTLPLISYGGSSLVTMLVSIGFLMNVGMRRPLF